MAYSLSMLDGDGAAVGAPALLGVYEYPDMAIAWTGSQVGALVTYDDPTPEEYRRVSIGLSVFGGEGACVVTDIQVSNHGRNRSPDIVAHDGTFSVAHHQIPWDPVDPHTETIMFARYGCLTDD